MGFFRQASKARGAFYSNFQGRPTFYPLIKLISYWICRSRLISFWHVGKHWFLANFWPIFCQFTYWICRSRFIFLTCRITLITLCALSLAFFCFLLKVHSFLKQCFAQSLIDKMWRYHQLGLLENQLKVPPNCVNWRSCKILFKQRMHFILILFYSFEIQFGI